MLKPIKKITIEGIRSKKKGSFFTNKHLEKKIFSDFETLAKKREEKGTT
jgi:hypothetical protein